MSESILGDAAVSESTQPPVSEQPPVNEQPPVGDPVVEDKPAAFSMYSEDGSVSQDLLNAIPEQYKSARGLFSKYKNAEELAKGLENLNHMASRKGLEKPADDAPDEVKKEYAAALRKANGAPDSVDGYKMNLPEGAPEGAEFDPDVAAITKQWAHENNLSQAALDSAVGLHQKIQEVQMKRMYESTSEAIKKEYGDKAGAILKGAVGVAQKLGLNFNNPVIGNNMDLIRALVKASDLIGETGYDPQGITPADAANAKVKVEDLAKKMVDAHSAGDMTLYGKLAEEYHEASRKAFSGKKY